MKNNISKKTYREFGFLIGFGFPILIGWFLPAMRGHTFSKWTLFISIPSLVITMANPRILFYPYSIWMKIGFILGWLNSRLILGLVFLIVLLPIAFIMKIIGYDPLKMKKNNQKSYREIKVNHKVNFKKIF